MKKEVSVLLVEDDFYSRCWMELLLRRDWRTRVAGEVSYPAELAGTLKEIYDDKRNVDLILLDTDITQDQTWLNDLLRTLEEHSPNTAILFIGIRPNSQVAKLRVHPNFCGYILKNEIHYSLAWAVTLAANRQMVITAGVREYLEKDTPLPKGTMILEGRKEYVDLDKDELKRARMVFIFSMERREFADEEVLTPDSSYGVVSGLYKKFHVNDILEGKEEHPELFLGDSPVILQHLAETREHLNNTRSKKGKDMETLAFHILTAPDVLEEIH